MFKYIALITLLVVSMVAAQKQYPTIPNSFQSDVSITNSQLPFPVTGTMYYDFPNQAQRVDSSVFGQSSTTLDRYDIGFTFQYDNNGNCQVNPLTGTQSPYSVLPGSAYKGTTVVNGVPSTQWEINMMDQIFLDIYVDQATNSELVEVVNTVASQGFGNITTTMDFSNFQASQFNFQNTFVPPSYCQIPTPPTPSPVPASACPNSAPNGCSCPPTLSFCSGVNYPVQGTPDFEIVDGLVEQMYNNFVAFAQPSSGCAADTKALLCATQFPQCSDSLIPLLPCAALCPTCACGGSSASCPTAPVSNNACTMYGTPSC